MSSTCTCSIPTAISCATVDGLVVHRRDGAPLTEVDGRPATTPAWTAVEVARSLRRPRALATLDAALRSRHVRPSSAARRGAQQAGRRGIVHVARADSPRQAGGRVADGERGAAGDDRRRRAARRTCSTRSSIAIGELWRVDFAWPDHKVAVEYDGFDWHSDQEQLAHGTGRSVRPCRRWAGSVLSIVFDDVRRRPWDMLRRIEVDLQRARARRERASKLANSSRRVARRHARSRAQGRLEAAAAAAVAASRRPR